MGSTPTSVTGSFQVPSSRFQIDRGRFPDLELGTWNFQWDRSRARAVPCKHGDGVQLPAVPLERTGPGYGWPGRGANACARKGMRVQIPPPPPRSCFVFREWKATASGIIQTLNTKHLTLPRSRGPAATAPPRHGGDRWFDSTRDHSDGRRKRTRDEHCPSPPAVPDAACGVADRTRLCDSRGEGFNSPRAA